MVSLLECSKYVPNMLSVSICNSLSCEKVLIMARDKELSNSQKALIFKLCKDGESKEMSHAT